MRLIYAAVTSMGFDWGCNASLVLKKGDQVVGEEVRDASVIQNLTRRRQRMVPAPEFRRLQGQDPVSPGLTEKICRFEIPSLPVDWCAVHRRDGQPVVLIYCNPSAPGDLFIKERYFEPSQEEGLGTILVGMHA